MKGKGIISLICSAALLGLWAQGRKNPPATSNPHLAGAVWESYQTILWSTQSPAFPDQWPERVREAGYTATPLSSAPLPGLRHYVSNLVPELGFHHAREPLYKTDFAGYTATRDRRFLTRKPCLDDPAFWDEITPRLRAQIARFAPTRPLLYDLRDEPSVGSFISPMDYCFCPHTLRAFREWLKTQYRSLADLNTEWETAFTTWDDVVPLTTYEIKDREKTKPASFAPWADHRSYMDFSFARAIERMRSIIRSVDPRTPAGIAGVQAPGAFGGYDLWKLSRVVDWMEPYDQGNAREIVGSFLPEAAPILTTYFGSDAGKLRWTAWQRLLDGDGGAIVWDDDPDRVILKTVPQMPITSRGRLLREILTSVRAAAPRIASLRRERDRIAIHYSQASSRAQWMFDSRPDGATWPKRLASYELEHSRIIQARHAYVRAIEDLGLTADFVSYEQVQNGELARGKYRAVILPGSVAMSSAECRRIEEFVHAGGVAIGDDATGSMDEHCRRVPAGVREGFRRSIQRGGAGAVAEVFRKAGIQAPVTTGAREIKIWRYSGDGRQVIALMQNPAHPGSTARSVRTTVVLPRRARVVNGAHDYGETSAVEVEIPPGTPVLLEVRPPKI
jgi:hypothetical protein